LNLTFQENLTDYIYISSIIFIILFLSAIVIIPNTITHIYTPLTSNDLRINSINSPFATKFPHLLINNVLISIILLLSGVFSKKILPSFILGYNAFLIGSGISMLISNPSTANAIYSMIPHGIIEIPTIILCTAFAYKFANQMQIVTNNEGISGVIKYKEPIDNILIEYVITPYLKYILPLLVLSVFIECTISIYILKAIFNGV
jgi:stage II sporulation protein M